MSIHSSFAASCFFLSCLLLSCLLSTSVIAHPLRIMTLGDSLTDIDKDPDTNNAGFYQPTVAARLSAAGYSYSISNRGIAGLSLQRLADNTDIVNLPGWLATDQPDVILLQIGTNNMNIGVMGASPIPPVYAAALNGSFLDAAPPYTRIYLKEKIETLFTAIVGTQNHPTTYKLVVAKIPAIGLGLGGRYTSNYTNCMDRINEYNGLLEAAVLARPWAKITIVDNFSSAMRGYGPVPSVSDFGYQAEQTIDWVHPRYYPDKSALWETMGNHFYDAMRSLLDSDHDGVVDAYDAFPFDPAEYAATNADCTDASCLSKTAVLK